MNDKFDYSNLLSSLDNFKFETNDFLKSMDSLKQMPNINIPKIDYAKLTNPAQEHREEEKVYWEESLGILKSIEMNTANLAMIVDLINRSNENQDKIIGIFSEVLEIAKATNKEEAESAYRKVMNKIISVAKDADAIQKITSFAGATYTLVINNMDKIEKAKQVVENAINNIPK